LCKRLYLKSSFCDPMFWLRRAIAFFGVVFVGGDRVSFSEPVTSQ
jgi:hypothetical protein